MIGLSCSDWEAQARLEFDSFAAVEVKLEEVDCQEGEQVGEYTLINCTGRIVASYGAEDLIIDLPERAFRVVHQGGEPRMCGYE